MKLWCVKVAYYYGEEAPSDELAMDTKLFKSEEEAVKELERVIREDWTTEVRVDDDDKRKSLADCRGMQEDEDSRKYSEWYYSEDGKLAWVQYGSTHSYRGEVVEIEVPEAKAEATC